MKVENKKEHPILWLIAPIVIIVCIAFFLLGLIVTEIEIKTDGNRVDAYVVEKFFFSPTKKFDEIIDGVTQVRIEKVSYSDKYEIIFENDKGKEYFISSSPFSNDYYSHKILVKQINDTIKDKKNKTFKIENTNSLIYCLIFTVILLFYICILVVGNLRETFRKLAETILTKKQNSPPTKEEEKEECEEINERIIK